MLRAPVAPKALTMSSSHIYLDSAPLTFDAKDCVVFNDAAHSQLIMLKNNAYYTLSILDGPGARLSEPITTVERGNVLCVKMSLDRRFLAVQRSSTDVDVVDLETSDQWTARIRAKGGNQLLCDGIIWSDHASKPGSSQDLVLVTSLGLEFFKVSPAKRTLKHIRNLNNKVVCFWYEPIERVVLLALGSQAAHRIEFDARPYQLSGAAPIKLPRLQLPGPLAQKDVTLLRLYGALFCAHVDTEAARLMLHRIGIGGSVGTSAVATGPGATGPTAQQAQGQVSLCLQLYMPGSFELSVVDNLLLCHSRDSRVTLLFDVQSPSSDPLVNPLPVARGDKRGSASFLWKGQPEALAAHFSGSVDGAAAKSSAEHDKESGPEQDEGTDGGSAGVYAPNWSFLAPLYALENCLPPQDDDQQAQSQDSAVANDDAGSRATYRRLWTLRVSLPEVVTSSSNLQSLLPLLLRRGQLRRNAMSSSISSLHTAVVSAAEQTARDAKEVLLRLLLTLVVEQSPLPLLSAVFDSLNEGYLKAMVERAYIGSSGGSAGVVGTEEQKGSEDEGGDDGRSSSPRFRMLSFGIGSGRNKSSSSTESASAKSSASGSASSGNASATGDAQALEPPSHACSALLSRWVDEQQRRAEKNDPAVSWPSIPSLLSPGKLPGGVISSAIASKVSESTPPPCKLVKRYSSGRLYGFTEGKHDHDVELACTLSTARNSRGHMIVLQAEMLAHVLLPASADTTRVQPQYLIALLAEYLRSLQRNYIPAQQALHELLAELLAAEGRLVELYQLLQYRVSSDSPVLALRLLEIGAGIDITADIPTTAVDRVDISCRSCRAEGAEEGNAQTAELGLSDGRMSPLCQLALDMLFRLRAHEHLVCALLAMRQLQPAMRVARASRTEVLEKYGAQGTPTRLAFARCLARRFFQVAMLRAHHAVQDAVIPRAGPLPEGSTEARSAAAESVFHSLHGFFREWEPALLRPQPKSPAGAAAAPSPNLVSSSMPPLFADGGDQTLPPFPDGLFLPKKAAEFRRMFCYPAKPRAART